MLLLRLQNGNIVSKMKKKVMFLLLALSPLLLFAKQEVIDQAYLKCSYAYTYEQDTLLHQAQPREDLLYLQIGHKVSKCYSYYTYQSDSLAMSDDFDKAYDNLIQTAIQRGLKGAALHNAIPHKRMTTVVYKNYPEGKSTVTDFMLSQYYIYADDLNLQDWNIEDSTKVIMGHECQKATCDFRGRKWTAWFATDVPVSDGPWKLCGLPGLVMEAYDKGYQQHFLINGLQQVSDEPIEFGILDKKAKKPQSISRKDFNKSLIHYLRNQNSINEAATGISLGSTDGKFNRDLLERDY